MTDRVDLAEQYFKEKGCSCSQAVLAAFGDLTGMDEETALRISAPFGGGISRLREVCGAVSGMCMVLGLLYGPGDPKDQEAKAAHYALVQRACEMFREKNGAIVCRTLLGLDHDKDVPTPAQRNAQFYQKRPCVEYVRDAASIVQSIVNEKA